MSRVLRAKTVEVARAGGVNHLYPASLEKPSRFDWYKTPIKSVIPTGWKCEGICQMRHNVRKISRPDDDLPRPSAFKRELDPHRKLELFLLRTDDGRPALEVLRELNARYGLGGAAPSIEIRNAASDRGPVVVIRNTRLGERTTGVSAEGMTAEDAKNDPTALDELAWHAEEKLLAIWIKNAPGSLRYTRILLWWLKKTKPVAIAPDKAAQQRQLNRKRGIRDPRDAYDMHAARAEKWFSFLQTRRLDTHGDEFGKEFAKWYRDDLVKAGAPLVGEYPEGGQESTIAGYHNTLADALKGFKKNFNAQVNLYFKRTYGRRKDKQHAAAAGFTGAEIIRLILFCLGFIWFDDGFAWELREQRGKSRKALLRLGGKDLKEHLAYYEPVLRLVLIYVLTGTRLRRIATLGWDKHDYRGWLNFHDDKIIRNGDMGPQYQNKPRLPSDLLPIARRVLNRLAMKDRLKREREAWDDAEDGGYYVVHDGCGGEVTNLEYRAKKAMKAVGISHSNHDMKSACVTLFWYAGFDLRRIARITGNDPTTLEDHYLWLVTESEGVLRPKIDEDSLTFLNFVDPKKRARKAPRASRPGLPPARANRRIKTNG